MIWLTVSQIDSLGLVPPLRLRSLDDLLHRFLETGFVFVGF